jgi:hypothetical protein
VGSCQYVVRERERETHMRAHNTHTPPHTPHQGRGFVFISRGLPDFAFLITLIADQKPKPDTRSRSADLDLRDQQMQIQTTQTPAHNPQSAILKFKSKVEKAASGHTLVLLLYSSTRTYASRTRANTARLSFIERPLCYCAPPSLFEAELP